MSALDTTTDPVEGRVSSAVAAYKAVLIMTNYRSCGHRLACLLRDQEALSLEAALIATKKRTQEVIHESPEHRAAFERIVKRQPEHVAKKDNLRSLLSVTIEP